MTDTSTLLSLIPVPYCISVEVQRIAGVSNKQYYLHILNTDIDKVLCDNLIFDKIHFPFLLTADLPDRYKSEIKYGDYILSNYERAGFYIYEPLNCDFASYYKRSNGKK